MLFIKLSVLLSLLSVFVSSEIVEFENSDSNLADFNSPRQSESVSEVEPIFSDFNISIGNDGTWKLNDESTDPKEIFNKWRKKYIRNYLPEEQRMRIKYFERTVETISNHNSGHQSSYEMAANKFADLSDEQFRSYYLMKPLKKHMSVQLKNSQPQLSLAKPQLSFQDSISVLEQKDQNQQEENRKRLLQTKAVSQIDWRKKIRFAPIKNQQKCASCYAFATVAVIELHVALRSFLRTQPIFSEQQIIDCFHSPGCTGCTCGLVGPTIKFLAEKGLANIKNYPYIAKESQCKLNKIKTFNIINKENSYTRISGESKILDYLLNKGPLAFQNDSNTWKLYHSGVFDGCNLNNFSNNHVATLIGVTKNYWIIRNSWGTDWGEKGYMRLKRGGGDACGILSFGAYYPHIK